MKQFRSRKEAEAKQSRPISMAMPIEEPAMITRFISLAMLVGLTALVAAVVVAG